MRKPKPVEHRLLSKIHKTESCWLWTASKDKKGYGRLMVKEGDRTVPRLAHRLSYECFVGPIPDGKFVCHRCDNPSCVNPDHLWLGSNRDNAYDMISKGRWKQPPTMPAEKNPNSKLTKEAVLEIRSVVGNTKALAEKYGVSITAIKRARSGQGWRTAPGELGTGRLTSKLSPEAVREIRNTKGGTKELALKHGVDVSTINRARRGHAWKAL